MNVYTRFNTLMTAVVIFGLWITVVLVVPEQTGAASLLLVALGTAIGAAMPAPKK